MWQMKRIWGWAESTIWLKAYAASLRYTGKQRKGNDVRPEVEKCQH